MEKKLRPNHAALPHVEHLSTHHRQQWPWLLAAIAPAAVGNKRESNFTHTLPAHLRWQLRRQAGLLSTGGHRTAEGGKQAAAQPAAVVCGGGSLFDTFGRCSCLP